MEKLLLLLFLFIATQSPAQPGDSINSKRVENKLISNDSIPGKPGGWKDTMQTTTPASDSLMRNEDMERNVSNLLSLQKSLQAREKKEKRNAIVRIGIGIVLLIILIIGLRRKSVKR